MSDIDSKIKEIFSRVDIAANGQISTSCWSEADINFSAPDGMDYWDWIEQATNDAISESNKITSRVAELEAALTKIKDITGELGGQNPANFCEELAMEQDDATYRVYKLSNSALSKALEQSK